MSKKTFVELDNLIRSKGLRYDYIADQLGITRQRLYIMRMDPTTISIDQMEKFATLLDVDFMDIYQIHKNFRKQASENTTEEQQEA